MCHHTCILLEGGARNRAQGVGILCDGKHVKGSDASWNGGGVVEGWVGKSIERSDIWYTKSIIGSPPKIFETVDAEVIQCVGCEPLPVINPNKQLIVKHSIVHLIGV